MYNPFQIPYLLNEEFKKHVKYKEVVFDDIKDFVICMWSMKGYDEDNYASGTNVIVSDGCIDLVIDYKNKQIGFAGMSKTEFQDEISSQDMYYGFRMSPGAFQEIYQLDATNAMDCFLMLKDVEKDFDIDEIFNLPFLESQKKVIAYLRSKISSHKPSEYMVLFQGLYENEGRQTVESLAEELGYSRRQMSRIFKKYYGINPKSMLNIIRFQSVLCYLMEQGIQDSIQENYYDQSHFIKDMKVNIGHTPLELIQRYQK